MGIDVVDYLIDDKYIYNSASTTKGTQIKYKKDDYFYKIDKMGREGFVEYLVSVMLSYSTLDPKEYVSYECCKINGLSGCRSRNFLNDEEEFVTVHSLYQKYTGNSDFANYLMTKRSAEERLEEILELVDGFEISTEEYRRYMNVLVQIDLLIANTDRHVHNYGVIMSNDGNFRMAPIFDNGRSLFTDNSNIFSACTLSGSFEEQVTAFGFPVKACFYIDYTGFEEELKSIEKKYGECIEITTLRNRLKEYEYIFNS